MQLDIVYVVSRELRKLAEKTVTQQGREFQIKNKKKKKEKKSKKANKEQVTKEKYQVIMVLIEQSEFLILAMHVPADLHNNSSHPTTMDKESRINTVAVEKTVEPSETKWRT